MELLGAPVVAVAGALGVADEALLVEDSPVFPMSCTSLLEVPGDGLFSPLGAGISLAWILATGVAEDLASGLVI